MEGLAERGMQFDYPPIEDVQADLLLVTHEHRDHNAVEVVGGCPKVLRSTAGTFDSAVGTVIGIASEHDDARWNRARLEYDLLLHAGWTSSLSLRGLRPGRPPR
jgi:hypothetical protein